MTHLRTLLATFLTTVALSSPSYPHDFWINNHNYVGPKDGIHCCGEKDCPEIQPEDVEMSPKGYRIKSLNEDVPFNEATPSEDGKYYRCHSYSGERRCFFAPTGSS